MSRSDTAFGRTLLSVIRAEQVFATFIFLAIGQYAWPVTTEQIKIADDRDSRFLPYSITISDSGASSPCARYITHPQRVYREANSRSDSSEILIATNSMASADSRAMVALIQRPGNIPIRELPSWLVLSDVGLFREENDSEPSIWFTGCVRDSAWIVCYSPNNGRMDSLFVETGEDRTGDGKWQCYLTHVAEFDYDFDGNLEQLFYLNSEHDFPPRTLICTRLVERRILWAVPLASPVPVGCAVPCCDRSDPGVLVCSYAVNQRKTDSVFSDKYGYLVRIDSTGQIRYKKVINGYTDSWGLVHLPADSSIFLLHTLPFLDDSLNENEPHLSFLSKLNGNGLVMKTCATGQRIYSIWTADYDGDGRGEIYTLRPDGAITIFDQNLDVMAQSGPTALRLFAGQLSDWLNVGQVLFFQEKGQMGVYTPRLDKIAVTPIHEYREVYSRSNSGHVTAFLGTKSDIHFVAHIERRSFSDMVATVYFDYRRLILGLLSSLLILLIVVNFYRRRVSAQKRQIETAHKELEETHEVLKRAQETIIAQEKYRQAKDIAGGFAHEIKNALFPADGALIKQERLLKESVPDGERLRGTYATVRGAMARALNLTRQISAYTKLDTEIRREPTSIRDLLNQVIAANDAPLGDRHITMSIEGEAELTASVRTDHLRSVFTNLLLNSIDALEQKESPLISVRWTKDNAKIALDWMDNGSGIADADLPHVFDAFFSTKPTTGTGLGLAMVKRILDLYGGKITVESRQGEGATFHILLPIYRELLIGRWHNIKQICDK